MNVEALYPYAIVGYSAFVTIFAVYLWKLTNRNVDVTRVGIQTQVANAIKDIKGQIDERLGDVPDIDQDAFAEQIRENVIMAIKSEQANLVKSTQAQLESMGLPAVLEEQKDLIMQQIPQSAQALQKLANWKVSKRFKEEHELEAFGLELAKAQLLSMIQGQRENMLGAILGTVTQSSGGSSSGGFNPGV